MTTTTERLLQLADEHDRKAAALRVAARELDTERTLTAQELFPQRLKAAVATRTAARANGNGSADTGERFGRTRTDRVARRRSLIQHMVENETHTTVEAIRAELSTRHHIRHHANVIWTDLRKLGARRVGDNEWRLSNGSSHPPQTRTKSTPKAKRKYREARRPARESLALARAFLKTHPGATTPELAAHLGYHSNSFAKHLRPIARAERSGSRNVPNRWYLRSDDSKGKPNGNAANGKAAEKRARARGGKKPPKAGAVAESLPIVLSVLRDSGPLAIKELAKEVRARGGGGLTGITNYVNSGALTRSGAKPGKYAYSVGPKAPSA